MPKQYNFTDQLNKVRATAHQIKNERQQYYALLRKVKQLKRKLVRAQFANDTRKVMILTDLINECRVKVFGVLAADQQRRDSKHYVDGRWVNKQTIAIRKHEVADNPLDLSSDDKLRYLDLLASEFLSLTQPPPRPTKGKQYSKKPLREHKPVTVRTKALRDTTSGNQFILPSGIAQPIGDTPTRPARKVRLK